MATPTPAPVYPTWRYHATLPAKIVTSPEEDDLLGAGWEDTPAKFLKDADKTPVKHLVVPPDPAPDPSYVKEDPLYVPQKPTALFEKKHEGKK